MRARDIARLGAGARRQIALEQLEQARLEALKVQAPAKPQPQPKRNKYGAVPVELHGHKFDSQAEGRHYLRLREREARGEIRELEVHPVYRLEVAGVPICKVIPDFQFLDRDGRLRVQDTKGGKNGRATITPIFRLKARLLKALHGIDIEVIQA